VLHEKLRIAGITASMLAYSCDMRARLLPEWISVLFGRPRRRQSERWG